MTNSPNHPKEYDAVLGGQAPDPVAGVVLGGIEGANRRLASPLAEQQVAVLSEALKYGDAGLGWVIQALQDESEQVQRSAYLLLKDREEPRGKKSAAWLSAKKSCQGILLFLLFMLPYLTPFFRVAPVYLLLLPNPYQCLQHNQQMYDITTDTL